MKKKNRYVVKYGFVWSCYLTHTHTHSQCSAAFFNWINSLLTFMCVSVYSEARGWEWERKVWLIFCTYIMSAGCFAESIRLLTECLLFLCMCVVGAWCSPAPWAYPSCATTWPRFGWAVRPAPRISSSLSDKTLDRWITHQESCFMQSPSLQYFSTMSSSNASVFYILLPGLSHVHTTLLTYTLEAPPPSSPLRLVCQESRYGHSWHDVLGKKENALRCFSCLNRLYCISIVI